MNILVVDDHPLVGEALRHVLQRVDTAANVSVVPGCDEGLAIAEAQPGLDLVLLDLELPGLSGIAALKAWRQAHPAVPVVVVSATEDRPAVLAALAAGAAGFIPKSSSNEVLLSAVNLVLAGGKYLPAQAVTAAADPGARVPRRPTGSIDSLGLTARQLEVLRLIAQGKPNKSICRELGLAERTVKAHVTAVLRALHASSRTQAALAATRLGLGP